MEMADDGGGANPSPSLEVDQSRLDSTSRVALHFSFSANQTGLGENTSARTAGEKGFRLLMGGVGGGGGCGGRGGSNAMAGTASKSFSCKLASVPMAATFCTS